MIARERLSCIVTAAHAKGLESIYQELRNTGITVLNPGEPMFPDLFDGAAMERVMHNATAANLLYLANSADYVKRGTEAHVGMALGGHKPN